MPVSMTKTSYFDYGDRRQISGTSYQYAVDPKQSALEAVRPCPECGYIQSWMQQKYVKVRRVLWFVGCFFLSLILLLPFAWFMSRADELSSWPNLQFQAAKINETIGYIILVLAGVLFISGPFFLTGILDFLIKPNRGYAKTSAKGIPQVNISAL
jgi:hypothetical protein